MLILAVSDVKHEHNSEINLYINILLKKELMLLFNKVNLSR